MKRTNGFFVRRPEGFGRVGVFATVLGVACLALMFVGSSRVDLQACKLEYSIVSPK